MNKYSYYTPIELAEEIIKLLPKQRYSSVIDICCGTWNLLSATQKYYPKAQFYGVDIDKTVEKAILKNSKFILCDGREFAHREMKKGRTYDLILSNPPFGRLKKEDIYWGNINNDKEFSALSCKRYETEMILSNIYLAHENSVLVFILPITFVCGESFKEARKQIAKCFSIHYIIELPIDTFKGSKLKTVAIIMKKSAKSKRHTNFIEASLVDGAWQFGQLKKISNNNVHAGNWIGEKIRKCDIQISRGKIHSGEMNKGDKLVLHCSSDYEQEEWRPSIRYTEKTSNIHAEYGDIIVNRIGKGVGYWCINRMDDVEISDCLFVIKNNDIEIVRKLRENTVDGKLNITPRGISTHYITQADICNLIDDVNK